MSDLIHAFDPSRRTNAQLMVDVHALGYLDGTILDMTYGLGKFWTHLPELNVLANDLDPDKGDIHYDYTTGLPLPESSINSVVFDPDYRMGGTPTTPDFDNRYGINRYLTVNETRDKVQDGIYEATRIASDFVMVKCQDSVSGGRVRFQTSWVISAGEASGARPVDSLHVVGGRPQPAGRKQRRSRHGYSTLLVFEVTA